ncbi:Uma2 family endonuclease [Streptomyces sp. Isolate_219]|uniref:Uma2 family endonuclease n=1 Tax=Streptomyces sp. Isolate_219 TaxID=2950110 RepID=UPI0021C9D0CD|nr:Uma2 family endonuclease [Streptomyces sp. Isolate_219]MCR8574404.1 Uma2 family endonuclease [Streptomyces sp. Isolate_219]
MTAVDERRMTELFENLEVPEGIKMELLRGEIVMMAGPDLVHNRIVRSVALQLPSDRWEWLMTQDIDILSEQSEPVPDLVVLKSDAGPESGRLLPSEVVTMLVEVVSKNSVDRDYGIKRSIYAAGKVPAYLIIDPIVAHCVLLTEPVGAGEEADYTVQRITKFGDPVPLEPLGVELDTSEFGTLPNVRPHRRP